MVYNDRKRGVCAGMGVTSHIEVHLYSVIPAQDTRYRWAAERNYKRDACDTGLKIEGGLPTRPLLNLDF
jgi:hypothetical protein